jgi:serine/threonine-protein kinase PknG
MKCTRAGCDGSYEDGYCNECGMAPNVATQRSAVPQPAAVATSGFPGSRLAVAATGALPEQTRGTAHNGHPSRGSRRSGHSGSTTRGRLGAGLVSIAPVPFRNPSTAVLTDPQVAERHRFCAACDEPVGRGRAGRPGRPDGFCPKCRAPFSFAPKLFAGDVVAGQYEVLGCLAHGGLGWIYLARDRNVSDRWIVLKGLLNAGDADALAAAVAERRHLAEVEHPNIVKIFNFAQHPDPRTGNQVGYIVMEYVGGRSVKELLTERRDAGLGALPVEQAIAYVLEILPALSYLHSRALIFCDFKPDNMIQTEEQLKLIDLGGVRRIDDDDSPIYGTVGYQAPEIASQGGSIASDIYTVGRTLAVLTIDFTAFASDRRYTLPGPDEAPLFAQHDSYHRLLRRATHPDPYWRFESADEMATQLTGVLREILAGADGTARPARSTLFGSEFAVVGTDLDNGIPTGAEFAAVLPLPNVDPADPAAGFLANLTSAGPAGLASVLTGAPVQSSAVLLRRAHVGITTGDLAEASTQLDQADALSPDDWRLFWYRALLALAGGDPEAAGAGYETVYDLLPGEAAPKLALAACAELAGRAELAAAHYRTVWITNHSFVGAAFGLARALLAAGNRDGAVAVLTEVPDTSSHYVTAQIAAVKARLYGRSPAELAEAELVEAGDRLTRLDLDIRRREELAVHLLQVGLAWIAAGHHTSGPRARRLLDADLDERALRLRLERAYRALAHHAASRAERVAMVEQANAIRPRTLI